jgi:hypothetical protein
MRRNKWVHEGLFFQNPNILIQETVKYMKEFEEANEKVFPGSNVNNNAPTIKWTAPPIGWYKANWDVALDKVQGRMGIGVVVREER